jgi:hypothetical protein
LGRLPGSRQTMRRGFCHRVLRSAGRSPVLSCIVPSDAVRYPKRSNPSESAILDTARVRRRRRTPIDTR